MPKKNKKIFEISIWDIPTIAFWIVLTGCLKHNSKKKNPWTSKKKESEQINHFEIVIKKFLWRILLFCPFVSSYETVKFNLVCEWENSTFQSIQKTAKFINLTHHTSTSSSSLDRPNQYSQSIIMLWNIKCFIEEIAQCEQRQHPTSSQFDSE